jgi:hypothetical protein
MGLPVTQVSLSTIFAAPTHATRLHRRAKIRIAWF